jgi:hypothetical protein
MSTQKGEERFELVTFTSFMRRSPQPRGFLETN